MTQTSNTLRFLQIEPTTRCNFTCGFCAGRALPQLDITWEDFCQTVNASQQLEHVELQGEGEPLMHPHFFDMVAYIHDKHPPAKISFITNGSLFTNSNIESILRNPIHKIFVSIESANHEQFQHIRGGKLQRVIRGIRALIEARQQPAAKHQHVPVIGFAITVLKSTIEQVTPIFQLYRDLNMDGGIMLQPLQRMDCYTRYYQQDMLEEIPDPQQIRSLRQLIANDASLQQILQTPIRRAGFYQDLQASVAKAGATCAWLENGLYISANGTACSCCFIKDAEKDGFEKLNPASTRHIKQQRQTMLSSLHDGIVPFQCQDCPAAKNILRSQQAPTQ